MLLTGGDTHLYAAVMIFSSCFEGALYACSDSVSQQAYTGVTQSIFISLCILDLKNLNAKPNFDTPEFWDAIAKDDFSYKL